MPAIDCMSIWPTLWEQIASIQIKEGPCGNPLSLRMASKRENDSEFIDALTRESMEDYVNETWKCKEKRDAYWEKNAQSQVEKDTFFRRRTFIILSGKARIGRITVSYFFPFSYLYSALKIENVHIDKNYRGKNIFGIIFEEITKKAPDKKIFLEVLLKNKRAAKLYFKNGFRLYRHPSWVRDNISDLQRYEMIYEPDEIYQPDRAFYLNKFSDILEKCRDNAVIFSLFLVTFNSIQGIYKSYFSNPNYIAILIWILLIFSAIAFTTYDLIAGKLYVQFRPTWKSRRESSWSVSENPNHLRVFGLLFLEFLMILFNVIIILNSFIVLKFIHNGDSATNFTSYLKIHYIFLPYCLWHLTNFLWYCISPIYLRRKQNKVDAFGWIMKDGDRLRLRDFARHGLYTIAHLSAFLFFEYYFRSDGCYSIIPPLALIFIVSFTIFLQSRRYLHGDFFNFSKEIWGQEGDKDFDPIKYEFADWGYKSMGLTARDLEAVRDSRGSLH